MKFNYVMILSLLLVVLANNSFASVRDFQLQRDGIIRDLQEHSILPQKIINDLSAITITSTNHFVKDPKASRKSAFADFKNRRVILNESADLSGDLTTLILHETLSASGWLDINYEYSVIITQLLADANRSFLSSDVRRMYKNQLSKIAKGEYTSYLINDGKIIDVSNRTLESGEGGAVIVGGGGDLKCAQIKEAILERFGMRLAYNPKYQKMQFSYVAFGMKIETVNDPAYRKRVRMKTIFDRSKGRFERMFYVPSNVSEFQAIRDIWYASFQMIAPRKYLANNAKKEVVSDIFIPRDSMEIKQYRDNSRDFDARSMDK